jgi:hypothetical protein
MNNFIICIILHILYATRMCFKYPFFSITLYVKIVFNYTTSIYMYLCKHWCSFIVLVPGNKAKAELWQWSNYVKNIKKVVCVRVREQSTLVSTIVMDPIASLPVNHVFIRLLIHVQIFCKNNFWLVQTLIRLSRHSVISLFFYSR